MSISPASDLRAARALGQQACTGPVPASAAAVAPRLHLHGGWTSQGQGGDARRSELLRTIGRCNRDAGRNRGFDA